VDRYSFLVRHFHPQLHAGLARRTTHLLFLILPACYCVADGLSFFTMRPGLRRLPLFVFTGPSPGLLIALKDFEMERAFTGAGLIILLSGLAFGPSYQGFASICGTAEKRAAQILLMA
jgi:hypothetical protein